MNKDKVIKDLRERNDKLKSQYEIMQIRNCALEQRVKSLEKRNKELEDGFKATTDELCEYAERIDKAIEYINKNKHLSMFADCREPEEDWNYDLEINPRELLNILQGDDNNVEQ